MPGKVCMVKTLLSVLFRWNDLKQAELTMVIKYQSASLLSIAPWEMFGILRDLLGIKIVRYLLNL